MTCLLRKYCLAALNSSLRALETVRLDDFFASLCDMAWQTKARDQLKVSGQFWPLLLAQGMQQVFWESRSYHKQRSAALSASRQYAKCCCLLWQSTLLHISVPILPTEITS